MTSLLSLFGCVMVLRHYATQKNKRPAWAGLLDRELKNLFGGMARQFNLNLVFFSNAGVVLA